LFRRVLSGAEIAALASPPAVPTGLTATAGGVQVTLCWTGAVGTTSYNLKRSNTNGGPYGVIASDLATNNFVDTNVVAGVTDYYVVSGVRGFYESINSAVAIATPQGPPVLGATLSAGSGELVLAWPTWAARYTLYSATSLGPPLIWAPITNLIASNNGQFIVTQPIRSESRFFHLSRP